jgi:hypothetical protein
MREISNEVPVIALADVRQRHSASAISVITGPAALGLGAKGRKTVAKSGPCKPGYRSDVTGR